MFAEQERHDIFIPVPTTFLEDKELTENMSGIIKHPNVVQNDNEIKVKHILLKSYLNKLHSIKQFQRHYK